MSVLVKGMKMPECCYECPMVHRGFDGYETRLDCYMVKDWCPEDEGVHPDCPLVALPDHHGRLVDADALIEQMEADAEHMDEPYAKMMYCAAISDVRHAQTIVEAEDES